MRRSNIPPFRRGGIGGSNPFLPQGMSIPPGGINPNVVRSPRQPPSDTNPFFFDINNVRPENYGGSYNPANDRSKRNNRGGSRRSVSHFENRSNDGDAADAGRSYNHINGISDDVGRRSRNRNDADNQSSHRGGRTTSCGSNNDLDDKRYSRSNRGQGDGFRGRGDGNRGRGDGNRGRGDGNRGRGDSNRGRGNNRQSNDGPRRNNDGGNRRRMHLGFKKMEELKDKEPEDILLELLRLKEVLKNMFEEDMTLDTIVLSIDLFSEMCLSKFINNLSEMLLVIVCETYMRKLEDYVLHLPIQTDRNRNRYFWNDINGFFKNLNFFCHKVVDILPNSAADFLPSLIKATGYTIRNLESENSIMITDETKTGLEEVDVKLATYLSKKEEKKKRVFNYDEGEPPDDFHDINIYPASQEITTRGRDFLRKNKVEGAYTNVSEYLDIQFRLLREDFVGPLRDGVCDYLEKTDNPQNKKFRPSSIRVYEKVRVVSTEISQNQLGFLIQVFTPNKKTNRNIENSKRFMFGSLLCFTTDNFKTILFGKVIDRKKEQLVLGRIVAGFDTGVRLLNDVEYKMAECKVYFEPYYHVLKALQSVSIEDFPLRKYLVDVDIDDGIEPPGYTTAQTLYTIEHQRLGIHNTDNWPDTNRLGLPLNDSQYEAYKSALSQKFSVIQGPPGTGKTYLGLKVAHTLLRNRDLWNEYGPMLVVCFTNHALDQFLEGILKNTTSIVRIGGQSRDDNLNQYNIKNLRRNEKKRGNDLVRDKYTLIMEKSQTLVKENKILKICNDYKSILSFDHFITVQHFADSWFYIAQEEEIINWLLEEFHQNRNKKTKEQTAAPTKSNQNNGSESEEEEVDDYINENNKERFGLDIDDDFLANLNCDVEELINLEKLLKNVQFLQNNISTKRVDTQEYFDAIDKCNLYEAKYDYLKLRLNWLQNSEERLPEVVDYNNPYRMPFNDRWLLYNNWLRTYRPLLMERIRILDDEYRVCCNEYNEVKDIQDIHLMRNRLVIGMTTTGAARLQTALQVLKCPIVIVEEAAEVLEAHIVTALSSNCQHLILIGDHKQLRPATADYHVDQDYKLGISLFERMVKNNFPCSTLNEQHRMRPEISSLITPAIYEHLEDHVSVMENVKIPGVTVPLYFIDHRNRESEASDSSKENYFEAIYVLKLARYLILNDVDPSKITIIAAYAGQLFLMLRERKQYERLRDVKIVVLDNYQGEENDIILLSLVRNNDNAIGFLSLENRVCVALSRAKHAMYIMGNMSLLCEKSKIWPKIKERLDCMNALGNALNLCCQNHQEITSIQTIDDFQKVAEGGCTRICESLLECGHICNKLCHMSKHDRCYQPCLKTVCEFDHPCVNKCYQVCNPCMVPKPVKLKCGHELDIPCHMDKDDVLCPIEVSAKLPCDHESIKKCYEDVNTAICSHQCDARIEPCGHACVLKCHIRRDPDHLKYDCRKSCERQNVGCTNIEDPTHKCKKLCFQECQPCNIIRQKHRTICPHVFKLPCHENVDEIVCMKPCKKLMDCGHICKRKCNETCGGCEVKVSKIIKDCGHSIKIKCSEEPTRLMCKDKCILTMSCGHPCKLKCSQPCDASKCTQLVPTPLRSPCGHNVKVPCNKKFDNITEELLSYCREPCTKMLECEHQCAGTCGECYQGRMHKSCQQKCQKVLVCSHECTINCNTMCQPCQKQCTYRCTHSMCKKKCGLPCTSCKEPCVRNCIHQGCSKKCFEKCDVKPCTEPCRYILECGHQCIGYCGEPCPPLCRICNKDEVQEIFFGTEDEEDARFVYLEECKHTLEGTELQRWFQTKIDNGFVGMMECPKCKARIVRTQRFGDYIKESYKNIEIVKKRHYGVQDNVEKDRKNLHERATVLFGDINTRMTDITLARELGVNFIDNLSTVRANRRQTVDQLFMKIYTSKFEIFERICKSFMKHKLTYNDAKIIANKYINVLLKWMKNQDVYITSQEIDDYTQELARLTRVMQFCQILNHAPHAKAIPEYIECEKILFSFKPYASDGAIKTYLEFLIEKTKNALNISETERLQILKAVGLSQGHWFKCPNGHVYAIGECGGAMQMGKCPECGCLIGGQSHTLTAGNQVATEMDGARHGAFSNFMNMRNFHLEDLE